MEHNNVLLFAHAGENLRIRRYGNPTGMYDTNEHIVMVNEIESHMETVKGDVLLLSLTHSRSRSPREIRTSNVIWLNQQLQQR